MIQQIHSDIISYIDYLRGSLGFSVTLSFNEEEKFFLYTPELYSTCIHLHPLCHYLKNTSETAGICVRKKYGSFFMKEFEFFYGCCWAGIEEYVFPIKYNGKTLVSVHVSGYRDNLPDSRKKLSHIIKKYNLPKETVQKLYNKNLKTSPPDKKDVYRFLLPFQYMIVKLWEEILSAEKNAEAENPLFLKIVAFIYNNIGNDFNLKDVSEKLQYSSSHIRHVFFKQTGKNISEYITDLRIEKSKELLKFTNHSIVKIAYQIGFNDSNYFSYVFKKSVGTPPLAYRKSTRQTLIK